MRRTIALLALPLLAAGCSADTIANENAAEAEDEMVREGDPPEDIARIKRNAAEMEAVGRSAANSAAKIDAETDRAVADVEADMDAAVADMEAAMAEMDN